MRIDWSTHLVASKGVVDLCNYHKTIKTLSTLRKLGQGSFLVPITLSGM